MKIKRTIKSNTDRMENNNKGIMLMVFFFFFCSLPNFSIQKTFTTIAPNQSMQYGDTLVSAAERYEAGFFNFGDPQRQYFGIWYKNISPRTIVWVANRNTPVHNSTEMLKLTDQGSLVILDGSKGIIWSSNSSRTVVKSVVQLLDSGNLVLKDANNSRDFLWESFDYPGNTFLAGMKLKSNLVTGPYRYLTSWKDPQDPAEGECSYKIDMHGFPQLVTEKGSKVLYRGGSWNGFLFTGVSWQRLHRVLNFSVVVTDKEFSYQYETLNSSINTRLVLDPYGTSQRFQWSDRTQIWEAIYGLPADQCDAYDLCGINSNCNGDIFPICECLEGFVPKSQPEWESSNWSGGCVRKTRLNCLHGDGFLTYTNMKLPDTSTSWCNKSLSLEECKTRCLKNCTCTAYANSDIRGDGSGCLLWFDNIVDMRKHQDLGQDIYIRLASSELGIFISYYIFRPFS
jgi:hypothetical protein